MEALLKYYELKKRKAEREAEEKDVYIKII